MKIFISHSHQNSDAAQQLVNFLLSSLVLEDKDIRCTSVPGHQLRFGKNIAELLKTDINVAPALIALVSKESKLSDWVMFELGAAWGLGRDIFPIIGPELQVQDLPGPLATLPCIFVDEPNSSGRMADLIQQLSEDLNIAVKNGGKSQTNLSAFLNEYSKKKVLKTQVNTPEDSENKILLAIWQKDETAYDEHGYSVEELAEQTKLAIPKCSYFLENLVKRKLVDKKNWVGGINGIRYVLTNQGKGHLIQKGIVV